MPKLISVSDGVVEMLDQIRKEKSCSYSKAIATLAAEKGRKDRILGRITDDFEYYKEIMPNIELELEIMRLILVWLYKASAKSRKEVAGSVREDLEKVMNVVIQRTRENGKKAQE